MKEKDCQIDNAHQLVLYVEKEDQSFGPVQTGSFMVENYLDDLHEKKAKMQTARIQDIIDGKISPLAYYKDLVEIGEGDLAARVGVSRRKLRSHLTPKGFSRLNMNQLKRYATVFGVHVAQLFQVTLCEDHTITIRNERTVIPEVIVSRISLKTAGPDNDGSVQEVE